jgi:hypothetical protein
MSPRMNMILTSVISTCSVVLTGTNVITIQRRVMGVFTTPKKAKKKVSNYNTHECDFKTHEYDVNTYACVMSTRAV